MTSNEIVGIVNCQMHNVHVIGQFSTSKETMGVIVAVFDILSLLIMTFTFMKLRSINEEYLNIIDNLKVEMSDFSILIQDVAVDKRSQDSRVLKMKLWLHINNMLKKYKEADNKLEIMDITLSYYTQPSVKLMSRLQEI